MEEFGEREMAHYRTTYDSMRLQTWFLLNIQLSKKDKIKDAQSLMTFSWDKMETKDVKQQSVEEMKSVLKGIVQTFKPKK